MTEAAIYTATMAKIYADQGHFEKAARIYRRLLKLEPDRQELKDALYAVEQKHGDVKTTQSRDITLLFEKWMELLLHYRNLRKLKKLQNTAFNPIQKRV